MGGERTEGILRRFMVPLRQGKGLGMQRECGLGNILYVQLQLPTYLNIMRSACVAWLQMDGNDGSVQFAASIGAIAGAPPGKKNICAPAQGRLIWSGNRQCNKQTPPRGSHSPFPFPFPFPIPRPPLTAM
jgi:hypothetical protein